MFKNRRLLTFSAIAATAATAVLTGPVTSAHAATPTTRTVSGNFTISISDEDSPDPDDDDEFSGTLEPKTVARNGVVASWAFARCVDEVRVVTHVTAQYADEFVNGVISPRVRTSVTSELYEGASCSTTDFDGIAGRDNVLTTTSTAPIRYIVKNQQEYGANVATNDRDNADVTVNIFAR
ncbi:hypothetical protein ACIHFC_37530 [Streptomyces sp. NPDC052013]|uniref:hypothetical protein n=1 Tax=Streptomyces sp. NPDC052013 TaxID=3365679 RepID=UPI0037D15590